MILYNNNFYQKKSKIKINQLNQLNNIIDKE